MSVGLRGQSLGQEGLARARRPVEQNPLGSLHPQPLEELGVLHGQFNHLPHLLDLSGETSDVLIGYPWARLLFFGWLVRDLYSGLVTDHCRLTRRRDPRRHQLYLSAHDRDLNDVSLSDDPAFHIPLQVCLRPGYAQGDGGGKDHRLCRSSLDQLDRHLIVYAHTGIAAGVAVQADHTGFSVFGIAGPEQCGCLFLALYADCISRLPAHLAENGRIYAGYAPSHIGGAGLNDFKRDICWH